MHIGELIAMNASDRSNPPAAWKEEGRRTYVIRGQGEIARIHFLSLAGAQAEVEACGRKYLFDRGGFIHPKVIARRIGEETEHAVLHLDPMGQGGFFAFSDGRNLRMERTSRNGELRVLHGDGSMALRITQGSGATRGEIFFDPAWAGDESGLMASMIIYAIVLGREEATTTAVGV
jgi:hypothetical protein